MGSRSTSDTIMGSIRYATGSYYKTKYNRDYKISVWHMCRFTDEKSEIRPVVVVSVYFGNRC